MFAMVPVVGSMMAMMAVGMFKKSRPQPRHTPNGGEK